jgi:hypothetical protein
MMTGYCTTRNTSRIKRKIVTLRLQSWSWYDQCYEWTVPPATTLLQRWLGWYILALVQFYAVQKQHQHTFRFTSITLTLWSWVLLEKPPVAQLLKNFPIFNDTRRSRTVFTRVLHWYLSWASSIQSIPHHPISLRSITVSFATVTREPALCRLVTFHVPSLMSSFLCLGPRPSPRPFVIFLNKIIFYGEELLTPRPTPKLWDHPLSAFRHCMSNIFVATLRILRPSSASANWGCAMPWWQVTRLTWTSVTQKN